MTMDTDTLATELLHEIKMSAKRWFIAFCIMVLVEIATIVGFLWYVSLPVETSDIDYEQEMEDVQGSRTIQMIGGRYYGEDETVLQEENNQESSQE